MAYKMVTLKVVFKSKCNCSSLYEVAEIRSQLQNCLNNSNEDSRSLFISEWAINKNSFDAEKIINSKVLILEDIRTINQEGMKF